MQSYVANRILSAGMRGNGVSNLCQILRMVKYQFPCLFHTSAPPKQDREGTDLEIKEARHRKDREMQLFKDIADMKKIKDKETFLQAIAIYEKHQSVHRRGHVDFILGAIDQMKEFSVHKDLEVYKALMEVFPKDVMVPKNAIQAEFMHYPRQQDTAIRVLIAMSNVGCIPDDKMGDIIISRFGRNSYVMKRYQRMMYWMPKFRNMNPYPVPWILPDDGQQLAVLALKRMAVDKRNEVDLYQTSDVTSSQDDTFIASAISPAQRGLIEKHDRSLPVFVEGGYLVWMRDQHLVYFVLRADPRPELVEYNRKPAPHDQDVHKSNIFSFLDPEQEEKSALLADPSVHEQPEGTVLAMCITGTSSKDSLMSWISLLQGEIPALSQIPVVFSLRTPESGLQPVDHDFKARSNTHHSGLIPS